MYHFFSKSNQHFQSQLTKIYQNYLDTKRDLSEVHTEWPKFIWPNRRMAELSN